MGIKLKNRPIVVKLRTLTSVLTKIQLQTLLTQMKNRDYTQIIAWFQAQGNPLTKDDIDTLNGVNCRPYADGVLFINGLIGEWGRERYAKFVADYTRDDLKPIRTTVVDRLTLLGETEEYGKDIFLDTLKSLVKELENG